LGRNRQGEHDFPRISRLPTNTFVQTLEFTNFFIEVPRTLRRFWFSFTFCIFLIAGMIILAKAPFIPYGWHINQIEAVIPVSSLVVSHILRTSSRNLLSKLPPANSSPVPLALNPGLMTFAW
jgi:hypothetical protein